MNPAKKIRHMAPHQAQGPTIRAARTSQGLSQRQLGEAIGALVGQRRGGLLTHPHARPFTQQYISGLERNLYCVAGRTATALGQVLGVVVPLPRMLPEQHAPGREAIRQVRDDKNKRPDKPDTPHLVAAYPQPMGFWP